MLEPLKIDLQRTTNDLIQHIEGSATRLEKFEGLRRGERAFVPLAFLRRESHILLRRSLILVARALKLFVRYRMPGG